MTKWNAILEDADRQVPNATAELFLLVLIVRALIAIARELWEIDRSIDLLTQVIRNK